MDISTCENQNRLFYKVANCNPLIEKTLLHNGYGNEDNAFTKSFPLPFQYSEKIIDNYKRYAEAMFFEEANLKQMKWREGLTQLASIAEKAGVEWWITGKIMLPLHGIDAEIDDVDFIFYQNDLEAVYNAFQDYIVEPIVCGGQRSDAFQYNGLAYLECTICLLAEPLASLDIPEPVHFGQYAAKNLETILWEGYKIKTPPIGLYIKTLERWGQTDRAQSIQNALQKTV